MTYNTLKTNTRSRKAPTPQSRPIPGREADMKQNNAGGFSFIASDATVLTRFLILGVTASNYRTPSETMNLSIPIIKRMIEQNGVDVINLVAQISDEGRAPNNDAALYVLAMCFAYGDDKTRNAAIEAFPRIVRIGTHLFHFAEFANALTSWNAPVRKAIARWYNEKTALSLVKQITKYGSRDGWSHRDVLRLAHPRPATEDIDAVFARIADKEGKSLSAPAAAYLAAVEVAKHTTDPKVAAQLITQYSLPREVLNSELQTHADVWAALLPHMGAEALIRNLPTLTRVGVIAPFSDAKKQIIETLSDTDVLRKARIHPVNVLLAYATYKSGHSLRGSNTWTPDMKIVELLNEVFYNSFVYAPVSGKNFLLALDVSGSMGSWGWRADALPLTPRDISAAMAMTLLRTEPNCEIVGFQDKLVPINLTKHMSLEQVIQKISGLPFGSTDCAAPMVWAAKNKISNIDSFVIYTDNETWAGNISPSQALQKYRQMGTKNAKLIVNAITVTDFTIADPRDPLMLDIAGFDSSAPKLVTEFSKL